MLVLEISADAVAVLVKEMAFRGIARAAVCAMTGMEVFVIGVGYNFVVMEEIAADTIAVRVKIVLFGDVQPTVGAEEIVLGAGIRVAAV